MMEAGGEGLPSLDEVGTGVLDRSCYGVLCLLLPKVEVARGRVPFKFERLRI